MRIKKEKRPNVDAVFDWLAMIADIAAAWSK